MKRFNLPFDKIHDITYSYGSLILPLPIQSDNGELLWLAYSIKYKFFVTNTMGFHNCTRIGIY